jgi:hypothetical protein
MRGKKGTAMMRLIIGVVLLAGMMLGEANAQNHNAQSHPKDPSKDPLKVAPQAYKLEFENEWVRVMRVRYGPREKIAEHYHTERPAAYVYLTDAGPVIFKHVDLPYGDITRAAVKAGTFRLYRAVKEDHAVENTSDTASVFLRIEFKTEPINQNSLRGKFHPEPVPAGENWRKTQFENEQIRVERLVLYPRKSMDVSTTAGQPALLVAFNPSKLQTVGPKGKNRVNLETGKTIWVSAGQQLQLENSDDKPVEMLRFEFKTKPFADPTDRMEVRDKQPPGDKKD